MYLKTPQGYRTRTDSSQPGTRTKTKTTDRTRQLAYQSITSWSMPTTLGNVVVLFQTSCSFSKSCVPQPQATKQLCIRSNDNGREAHRDRTHTHRQIDPPGKWLAYQCSACS